MKSKKKKILLIVLCLFLLTGCTKTLKNDEKRPVKNIETGQVLTENIICKPTEKTTIDLYNKYANKYEGRLQGIIDYDNDSESINLELDSTNLLILSYLIASVIASNKVSEFTDVWGTFAKEAGITNYNAQVNARQERQHEFENKAISLIEDLIDTFEL